MGSSHQLKLRTHKNHYRLPPSSTFLMADKLHLQSQLEQLQSRYVGVGHADIIKYDWAANIHRDTLASSIGHPSMSAYLAVAEGENIKRVQFELLEKMIRPIGNPPVREE